MQSSVSKLVHITVQCVSEKHTFFHRENE